MHVKKKYTLYIALSVAVRYHLYGQSKYTVNCINIISYYTLYIYIKVNSTLIIRLNRNVVRLQLWDEYIYHFISIE